MKHFKSSKLVPFSLISDFNLVFIVGTMRKYIISTSALEVRPPSFCMEKNGIDQYIQEKKIMMIISISQQ